MSLFYEILKVGWPVLFTVIFPVLCMYLESHESSTDTCWMSESDLYLFVYAHLYFFNLFHWGCILLQWERNNKYFFLIDVSFLPIACCFVHQSCPLFATPWTVACQAPWLMGFFRQEYWSWLPFFLLPDQGLNPRLQCLLHCSWILYLLSYQENPAYYYSLSES